MATKLVRKWFWVWEFEKEEQWLNDMAKDGWVLDGVDFCKYQFTSCEPGTYSVRLEMLEDLPHTEKGMDYIGFVEECGAKYIGNYMKWVYFRKKCDCGPFDLFSDIDSRIKHIDRIMKAVGGIGAANLLLGIIGPNQFAWVNLLCAALLGLGCLKLKKMKNRLEKDRTLHD